MSGSYFELAIGLTAIILAAALWRYLFSAFRRVPAPILLRSDIAAHLSAVLDIALLAVGIAYVIDGLAKAIP